MASAAPVRLAVRLQPGCPIWVLLPLLLLPSTTIKPERGRAGEAADRGAETGVARWRRWTWCGSLRRADTPHATTMLRIAPDGTLTHVRHGAQDHAHGPDTSRYLEHLVRTPLDG